MSDKPIPERWFEKYVEIGPDGDGAEKHLRAAIEELGTAEAERDALKANRDFYAPKVVKEIRELQAKNDELVRALENVRKHQELTAGKETVAYSAVWRIADAALKSNAVQP